MSWKDLSIKEKADLTDDKYIWSVYCHISPSNKRYIGITSRNPEKRWNKGYGYVRHKYIYNAIKKYGWNSFKHEILYTKLTKGQAEILEKSLIHFYKTKNKEFGYNLTDGGEGVSGRITSEETKRKISQAHKGKHIKGHPHTEESKRKLSISHLGKKFTEEARYHMSLAQRGKKMKAHVIEILKTANSKAVICIETGKEYKSIKEASEKTGIADSSIGMCCNKKLLSAGKLHWKFKLDIDYRIVESKVTKKIYCEELNKIFNSIREASLETGIPFNCISNVICGVCKTAGKLHWRRIYE